MSGRDSVISAVTTASQGLHKEAGIRSQGWVSTPSPSTGEVVVLTGMVTIRPNVHPKEHSLKNAPNIESTI